MARDLFLESNVFEGYFLLFNILPLFAVLGSHLLCTGCQISGAESYKMQTELFLLPVVTKSIGKKSAPSFSPHRMAIKVCSEYWLS